MYENATDSVTESNWFLWILLMASFSCINPGGEGGEKKQQLLQHAIDVMQTADERVERVTRESP